MRHVILVHGDRSGIGKDYFTNNLVQALAQLKILVDSFKIAAPVKELCRQQFAGVLEDYEYEDDRSLRELPIEGVAVKNVVDLWIKVGEFYRGLDNTHWVKETAANIFMRNNTVSVISDFRFDCEWEYFNKLQQEGVINELLVVKICASLEHGEEKGRDGLVTIVPDYVIMNEFTSDFVTKIQVFASSLVRHLKL